MMSPGIDTVFQAQPTSHVAEESVEECTARLQRALQQLTACPQARRIWESVQQQLNLKVECVPKGWLGSSTAEYLLGASRILVATDNPSLTADLLFETLNANDRDPFVTAFRDKCHRPLEGTVEMIETAEYEHGKAHHEIAHACVEQGIWPESVDRFRRFFISDTPGQPAPWETFERYLKTPQALLHADQIRWEWHQACSSLDEMRQWVKSQLPRWSQVNSQTPDLGDPA